MPFDAISRDTLELLYSNVRASAVLPGSVPPGRGDAAGSDDPSYAVADDLIQAVTFQRVPVGPQGLNPHARQFQLVARSLPEPPFTARGASTPWSPGATVPFGVELYPRGTRFKKLSLTVRSDELMVHPSTDDVLRVQQRLSRVAILRALSEAILFSNPASDDEGPLAGIPYYLPANSPQNVDFNAARGLIGGLSEIVVRCHPGAAGMGSRPDALVMSSRAEWRLCRELEDKGLTPQFHYCRLTRSARLHFHGIPVLNGRIPEPASAAGPALTEAWAMKLRGSSGVRVLHIGGDDFGLRLGRATTVVGLDPAGEARTASTGIEVFGVYAVLVPEEASVARLRRIPAGNPYQTP